MNLRLIPTGVHGVLDYPAGGVNLAFPDGRITRANLRGAERALALLVVPGMVVVRDPQGFEAGLLGHPGLL